MWRILRSFQLHDCFALCAALATIIALEAAKDHPIWRQTLERSRPPVVTETPATSQADQVATSTAWPDGRKYLPAVYASWSATTPVDELSLTPEQERAYRADFATEGYFGAFAASPDGSYGWTAGYGELWLARAAALALCEQSSSHCRVVSDIRPSSRQIGGTPSGGTLSYAQLVGLMSVRMGNGPRAFARNRDGTWGAMTAATADEAARGALKNCLAMDRSHPGGLPATCSVVAVWEQ